MTTERRAGIYMIRNEVTGDRYYGSSVNLRTRSVTHLSTLRRGVHRNRWLQSSWNKYGEAAFTFTVLAVLERNEVLATEQRLLDANVGTAGCMNLAADATAPTLGMKHSAASIAKSSAKLKGRVFTDEWRARISAAKRGVPTTKHSAETRAKMSASIRAAYAGGGFDRAKIWRTRRIRNALRLFAAHYIPPMVAA